MRTDVKVGLICAFVIVLGLVIYFVVQQNNHPKAALAGTQTAAPDHASVNAAAPVTPALTPVATAPAVAEPSNTPQLLAAAPTPNSVSGPMITLPGAATGTADTTQPSSAATTQPSLTGGTPGGTPPAGMSGAPTGLSTPSSSSPLVPGGSMGTPNTSPGYGSTGGRGFGGANGYSGRGYNNPGYGSGYTGNNPGRSLGGANGSYSAPGGMAGSSMSTPASSDSSSAESTYKIQAHDMLGTIAPKFHTTAKAIEAANPGLDPTRLKVGTSIKIPAPSAPSASSSTSMTSAGATDSVSSSTSTTKPSSKHTAKPATAAHTGNGSIKPGSTYTVKKGDTLTTISQAAYGSKAGWRRIFRANQSELSSADDVPVGTKLEIPR